MSTKSRQAILIFLIDRSLFDQDEDVIFVCSYVPPEGSPYYVHFDIENGISSLEECLTDCILEYTDAYVIICGDLNSRTDIFSADTLDNKNGYGIHINSRSFISDRKSADKLLNNYGRHLLNMCTSLDLCILNGICYGDLDGQLTYISQTGNSVNDYVLLSKDLFSIVFSSCTLLVSDRLDSDHSPAGLHFIFSETSIRYLDTEKDQFVEKIVWNHDLEQLYIDALNSDEGLAMLNHAISLIGVEFNEFIRTFGVYMDRKICLNIRDKQNDW